MARSAALYLYVCLKLLLLDTYLLVNILLTSRV